MIIVKEIGNYRLTRDNLIYIDDVYYVEYAKFNLQVKKKFLWFSYWSTFKSIECNFNNEAIKFNELNLVALLETIVGV